MGERLNWEKLHVIRCPSFPVTSGRTADQLGSSGQLAFGSADGGSPRGMGLMGDIVLIPFPFAYGPSTKP